MDFRHGVKRIATAAILAFAAVAAIGEASAEPNKVKYELQERCGNRNPATAEPRL